MHQVVQRENYENCCECGSPLKKVRHARTSPKICYDCRGSRQSSAVHVRNIFKEIRKNAVVVTDPLEDVFVDDPRNDLTTVQVQNDAKIGPSFLCLKVCNVTHPDLI